MKFDVCVWIQCHGTLQSHPVKHSLDSRVYKINAVDAGISNVIVDSNLVKTGAKILRSMREVGVPNSLHEFRKLGHSIKKCDTIRKYVRTTVKRKRDHHCKSLRKYFSSHPEDTAYHRYIMTGRGYNTVFRLNKNDSYFPKTFESDDQMQFYDIYIYYRKTNRIEHYFQQKRLSTFLQHTHENIVTNTNTNANVNVNVNDIVAALGAADIHNIDTMKQHVDVLVRGTGPRTPPLFEGLSPTDAKLVQLACETEPESRQEQTVTTPELLEHIQANIPPSFRPRSTIIGIIDLSCSCAHDEHDARTVRRIRRSIFH
jgi:hypothetical protein